MLVGRWLHCFASRVLLPLPAARLPAAPPPTAAGCAPPTQALRTASRTTVVRGAVAAPSVCHRVPTIATRAFSSDAAFVIDVPALGDSITEGTVVGILKGAWLGGGVMVVWRWCRFFVQVVVLWCWRW